MTTMTTGTTDLADFLSSIGVDVRRAGQEISARCPVHVNRTGKEDRSPSFSMNAQTGLWLCYSCGAKGTLQQLVRELTGKDDDAVVAMVMENNVAQLSLPKVEQKPEVDINKYLSYKEVPKRYLNSRNLSEEAARYYGIRWNPEANSWIIPIVSSDNELMGWQEKGVGFTYNHPTGVKKGQTLFGINRAKNKTAIIVESPLDVVRFASSFEGIDCLATYGAQVTAVQIQLACIYAEKLIIATDNDAAGIASAKRIFKEVPLLKGGCYWLKYSHTDAKDIGEMTDEEIEEAVVGSSVIPWWM